MSDKEPLIFGDDDPTAPDDLPEVQPKAKTENAVDAARTCEKCGSTSIRINSTSEGRRAWCNGCGHNWGISMATSHHVPDGIFTRGLSKQTIVEPDWSLAFEDLEDWEEDKNK